ncbi:inhibitor of growth protein 5-like [Saccoglossus kowalevskii]
MAAMSTRYTECGETFLSHTVSNNFKSVEDEILEDDEYCYCCGTETMEMIACDGKDCPVVWFHYTCVGLSANTVPEGDWTCRICSGNGSYGVNHGDKRQVVVAEMDG